MIYEANGLLMLAIKHLGRGNRRDTDAISLHLFNINEFSRKAIRYLKPIFEYNLLNGFKFIKNEITIQIGQKIEKYSRPNKFFRFKSHIVSKRKKYPISIGKEIFGIAKTIVFLIFVINKLHWRTILPFSLAPLLKSEKFIDQGPLFTQMEIVCREMVEDDIGENFPDILSQLTQLGQVKDPVAIFRKMKTHGDYKIFIIHDKNSSKVIGAATLHIENKFIHNGGSVGNVEDVVVDLNHRNRGFGRILVEKCIEEARNHGCYKTKLTCSEKNVQFYEKVGFKRNGVEMCLYFDND